MSGTQSLLSHGREPPRASLAKVSFSQGCTLPTEGQLNLGKTPVHRHHHPTPTAPELWEGSEETGIPERPSIPKGPEDQPPHKRGNRPKHRLRPAQGHTPSTRGENPGLELSCSIYLYPLPKADSRRCSQRMRQPQWPAPYPRPQATQNRGRHLRASSQGQLQTASWVPRRRGPAPPLPPLPAAPSLCQPRAHTLTHTSAPPASTHLVSPWHTPARGARTRRTHAGEWRRRRKEGTDRLRTDKQPGLGEGEERPGNLRLGRIGARRPERRETQRRLSRRRGQRMGRQGLARTRGLLQGWGLPPTPGPGVRGPVPALDQ